jgi:hypothetical protein
MEFLKKVLSGLFCLAIAGGAAWFAGPGLLQDQKIKADYEISQTGEFIDGECSTRLVFSMCNTTLRTAGGKEIKEGMFWADFNAGDYAVDVVQAKGDPENITTSVAIDKFWNRAITTGAIILLFGFMGVAALLAKPTESEPETETAA